MWLKLNLIFWLIILFHVKKPYMLTWFSISNAFITITVYRYFDYIYIHMTCVSFLDKYSILFTQISPVPHILPWHGHLQAASTVLWLSWDKFTWTTESCGGKQTARSLSQWESMPTLPLTGFYCFSGHITLRMVLIYYAQVCFRCLPFTENKGEDVVNYIKNEGYLQM